ASRAKRDFISAVAICACMNLTANSRSVPVWMADHTSPMPPAPRRPFSRYFCATMSPLFMTRSNRRLASLGGQVPSGLPLAEEGIDRGGSKAMLRPASWVKRVRRMTRATHARTFFLALAAFGLSFAPHEPPAQAQSDGEIALAKQFFKDGEAAE